MDQPAEQIVEKKKLVVEQRVYKIAFLHALKYVADDLIGILVGKIDQANNNQITLVDAFPLTHTRILAPTLEVALTLIEQNISEKNLKIVGIYETVTDYKKKEEISDCSAQILDKIYESIKQEPVCLKIIELAINKDPKNNKAESQKQPEELKQGEEQKLNEQQEDNDDQDYDDEKDTSVLTYIPYNFVRKGNDEYMLRKIFDLEQPEKPFYSIEDEIKKGSHRKIIDFDNHFEEIQLDFTNKFIN